MMPFGHICHASPHTQVLFGVERADDVEQTSATAACVAIVTLEGERIVAALDGSGVWDTACKTATEPCDSLNSLLINRSPAFRERFHGQLCAGLLAAVAERDAADSEANPTESDDRRDENTGPGDS